MVSMFSRALVLGMVGCLQGVLWAAESPNLWVLKQVTQDMRSNHSLSVTGKALSPDGRWAYFDRNVDGIRSASIIARINLETLKETTLYDAQSVPDRGPGVAAVSCFPDRDQAIFIHGPMRDTGLTYERYRRFGAILGPDGRILHADARDVIPPFTRGALRGGTHVHDPGGTGGQWIGFTYDDMVMRQRAEQSGGTFDLRTIGVTRLGTPVRVKPHPENWNGEGFSVVLVSVVPKPAPGTPELSRADGDGWVGQDGYIKDGRRQLARAFRGTDADNRCDVFVVDIPDDITVAGPSGPLEGAESQLPAPPAHTTLRRLTQIGNVSGYVKSNKDGPLLAFYAGDAAQGKVWLTPSAGGESVALTEGSEDFCWHPSGDWLAIAQGTRIFRVPVTKDAMPPPEPLSPVLPGHPQNLSFSPDGSCLAFNVRVDGMQQVFLCTPPIQG